MHKSWATAKTAALETPTIKDIAWAAGIYEGEGCAGLINGTVFKLQVTQKDTWLLARLRALFGGTVTHRRCKYKGGEVLMSEWKVYGARARGFAFTIFSFLSPRRKEQIKNYLKRVR